MNLSDNDYDYVICLHGDGQYPPDKLEVIYNLLSKEKYDMVQGSRVNYIKGGMPIYKIISNKFLNTIEESVFKFKFLEYHSGYRGTFEKTLQTNREKAQQQIYASGPDAPSELNETLQRKQDYYKTSEDEIISKMR